jgi:hypothetical protein
MRLSSAQRDFNEAAYTAKIFTQQDGLVGSENEYGEYKWTIQQGLKAACFGREDTAAVVILQQKLLTRLDTLKTFLSLCIALLIYIAYKIS